LNEERKKTKLFGIINPIDLLAILLVLALAAFAVMFLLNTGRREYDRYVEFTVEVRRIDMDIDMYGLVQVGDSLRDTIFNVDMGTVVRVSEPIPHFEWIFNFCPDDPQFVKAEVPLYETIEVTIRSRGFMTERAIEIISPGFEVRMGRTVHFKGIGYQGHGIIVKLEYFLDSEVRADG
jgi:hypothetical protein